MLWPSLSKLPLKMFCRVAASFLRSVCPLAQPAGQSVFTISLIFHTENRLKTKSGEESLLISSINRSHSVATSGQSTRAQNL